MRASSGGLERLGRRGEAIAVLALACAALAGCTPSPPTPHDTRPTPTGSSIYVPPRPSLSASASPTGSPQETAVVTIAGVDVDGAHVSFAGLVTRISEDGGACRFEAVSASGSHVTATSVGASNGATTTCPLVQIPIAQFARGSWTVSLTYHSASTDSVSAPTPMEVP